MNKICAAILAGGNSKRMGEDKAKLPFAGQTLLDHMVKLVKKSNIEKIFISGPDNIKDIIKKRGPLSGIHAILSSIDNIYEYILFVPVDMPELQPTIIDKLLRETNSYHLIKFEYQQMPFLLQNNRDILELLEKILKEGENFSLSFFHAQIKRQKQLKLLPKERIYFNNINYKAEWDEFLRNRKNNEFTY